MKQSRRCRETGIGGLTVIGLLVVGAIIIWLAVQMIPHYTGAGITEAPPGKAATPVQRAESVECRSNLTQIRSALTSYEVNNEQFPASLEELAAYGVVASMGVCPVGGLPYAYDGRTGQVQCRQPGHERY